MSDWAPEEIDRFLSFKEPVDSEDDHTEEGEVEKMSCETEDCDHSNDEDLEHDESDLLGAAATVDWRSRGAVTSIKDQGRCNGCYAFAAAVDMEGAYKIKTGKLMDLSPKKLIDRSKSRRRKKQHQGANMPN